MKINIRFGNRWKDIRMILHFTAKLAWMEIRIGGTPVKISIIISRQKSLF